MKTESTCPHPLYNGDYESYRRDHDRRQNSCFRIIAASCRERGVVAIRNGLTNHNGDDLCKGPIASDQPSIPLGASWTTKVFDVERTE